MDGEGQPTPETIHATQLRISGRTTADEIWDLLVHRDDRRFMKAFLERIEQLSGVHVLHRHSDESHVKEQVPVARLGRHVMPFGQYSSREFDDIPLDYLDWLCRDQEEFLKDLKAYLKHPDLEAHRRSHDAD